VAGNRWDTSLAVLPLHALSSDPEQELLADGMTDALIAHLSRSRASEEQGHE
jgi:TolB-like protein